MTPEGVVERWRADAESLRRRGFGAEADRIAAMVSEMSEALEPIKLVPEHVAMVRSGRRVGWLRAKHPRWMESGAAAVDQHGSRLYRLCILPHQVDSARAEGEAEAVRVMRAAS